MKAAAKESVTSLKDVLSSQREPTRSKWDGPGHDAKSRRDAMLAKVAAMRGLEDENNPAAERAPSYLIHPSSPALNVWNILTYLVLIYIALFTPVEVSFLPAPTLPSDPLFILGRVVDVIFALDMLLQCFIMFPLDKDDKDGTGEMERRPQRILAAYLRGWFLLDLVSLAASIFDYLPMLATSDDVGSDDRLNNLTAFRVVRILRLIKLVRLLKASSKLKDWFTYIPTPRATVTIIRLLTRCFLVTHWFGCVLGLITNLPSSQLDTWLATHGYCRPALPEAAAAAGGLGGGDAYAGDAECTSNFELYFACVWWSAGMLMGAPISMSPHKGPYDRFFSEPEHATLLTLPELTVVYVLDIPTPELQGELPGELPHSCCIAAA